MIPVSGFVKLYGTKLLKSTLWLEPLEVRMLFITMLALADRDGIVDVPGARVLARAANMDVEEVERALAVLEAPDPDSRTPDEDGRRVIRDGSVWRVVNYAKYREFRSEAQERHRKVVADWRARNVTGDSRDVTPATSATEAEADKQRQKAINTVASAPDLMVEGVLAAMTDAVKQLDPKKRGPRDAPQNRKDIMRPVKECNATLEDWQLVIRRQLASVRSDRSKWVYLSLGTLGVPKNFQRLLDAPAVESKSSTPPEPIPCGSREDIPIPMDAEHQANLDRFYGRTR